MSPVPCEREGVSLVSLFLVREKEGASCRQFLVREKEGASCRCSL